MRSTRRHFATLAALAVCLGLAACGPPQPMTQARAERLCADEARAADGISGTIAVGGGSEGARVRGGVTVTDRVLNPVSQDEALRACTLRRLNGGGDAPRPNFSISIGGST